MPLPFFASVRPRARKWRRERRNRLRARALMRLIDNRLPAEYDVTGDHDAWPLIGTALLSRTTTTLRTMMALQGRPQGVDAATLGRSLYEHVVHLAWLAADPNAARIEEWRKHDLTNRLKADADARTCGEELLDNAARAAMQAQVAAMEGNNLVLVNIAIAADQHWADRLPGMGTHQQRNSFKAPTPSSTAITAGPHTPATEG